MSGANHSLYRHGSTLFGDLRSSVKTAFGSFEEEKKDKKNPDLLTMHANRATLELESAPSCSYCNARMDRFGYGFASRMIMDEVVYYCNNPVCNGGSLTESDSSGGRDRNNNNNNSSSSTNNNTAIAAVSGRAPQPA